MTCPKCKTKQNNNFCAECGEKLRERCAECGEMEEIERVACETLVRKYIDSQINGYIAVAVIIFAVLCLSFFAPILFEKIYEIYLVLFFLGMLLLFCFDMWLLKRHEKKIRANLSRTEIPEKMKEGK
jgi:hypothetical protein